jgi:uncharacterized protein YndB with AHSA1/START domain
MNVNHETTAKVREIVITRMFNAPRKLVWKAWTDPELFKKWWGPKDFSCTVARMDFRVGGKYLYNMLSADGQQYWSTGTYIEIIPLEKIAMTDNFGDEKGNVVSAKDMGMPGDNWPETFFITLTFEEIDGKTRLTLKHAGVPDGEMNEMTNAGWNQSFDKLGASLK